MTEFKKPKQGLYIKKTLPERDNLLNVLAQEVGTSAPIDDKGIFDMLGTDVEDGDTIRSESVEPNQPLETSSEAETPDELPAVDSLAIIAEVANSTKKRRPQQIEVDFDDIKSALAKQGYRPDQFDFLDADRVKTENESSQRVVRRDRMSTLLDAGSNPFDAPTIKPKKLNSSSPTIDSPHPDHTELINQALAAETIQIGQKIENTVVEIDAGEKPFVLKIESSLGFSEIIIRHQKQMGTYCVTYLKPLSKNERDGYHSSEKTFSPQNGIVFIDKILSGDSKPLQLLNSSVGDGIFVRNPSSSEIVTYEGLQLILDDQSAKTEPIKEDYINRLRATAKTTEDCYYPDPEDSQTTPMPALDPTQFKQESKEGILNRIKSLFSRKK